MDLLADIGLLTLVFGLTYFIVFAVGLARIFKQAGVPTWKAFIPAFNFIFLVDLVGLPRYYFWYSLVPYIGTLYAFGVMNRLSKAYGRTMLFTSVWLTFAAALGVHVLLYKTTLNKEVFSEPAPSIKELQAKMRRQKKQKK